jgi:uncharacterized membrane protein
VKAPRAGELVALAGAGLVIASLALRWYEAPLRSLTAWQTFGPAVVLLMLAALTGLILFAAALFERTTALPVAAAVWATTFGVIGAVAAVVRLLERPDDSTALCAGAWVAFAGALLLLAGGWQSMRDERTHRYPPPRLPPRTPPPA